MQELEKILQEIRGLDKILLIELLKTLIDMGEVEDIIRKHVSGKDTDVPTNDGWIPVDKQLPEAGEHVLVSFKSAGFLPATAIISENGRWSMLQGAKGFNDVTEDVIAWRPLPEPYRPKKESEGSRRLREREEFFKE
ncbi:MAG TPA: DUF551 domain-containing protein [Candidatus Mediterraneibacter excrementavium]|nr:DUF551 domain-containing protein [Candidatus Mediterraneibacter excrementavium]